MEDLAKVFGARLAKRFMKWTVVGRDGVSERRIGPKREKTASDIGTDPDGEMFVGERFRLDVTPPFPGHLQLWNLGTSGRTRLLGQFPVNGECRLPDGCVEDGSPTTAETGRNDILIGIITREPVEIDPAAMGAARSAVSTRGSIGAVEEVKETSLSDLPEGDWEWCILETEVKR